MKTSIVLLLLLAGFNFATAQKMDQKHGAVTYLTAKELKALIKYYK